MIREEPRVILIYRETPLDELVRRFNTLEQTRFYVEHLGADFSDYEEQDSVYKKAIQEVRDAYQKHAKVQLVDRAFLSNFIFAGDETVVVVGQDGLVANTLKYVAELPVVAINPDPARYDGVLLPFESVDVKAFAKETLNQGRALKGISLAQAKLSNGQALLGVNDIFIGPKQHNSARYILSWGERSESQSSSGIIVSTGLGSTGWFRSLLMGAKQIAGGLARERQELTAGFSWDASFLYYSVREPFPSMTTGTELVFGQISNQQPLKILSQMPENGVIFSDGMLEDAIQFHSGLEVEIGVAPWQARLMV